MSDLKPLGEKAPLNLLPAAPLRAISSVMEHGGVKYAPWNYTDNSQAQARIGEQLAALCRHAFKVSDPTESDYDDESGLHHLAHVGACVLILLMKLGIDYEPSWFVRYPDLCQAWKDAEGPEAKAAALAAIQERAAEDNAPRFVPQPGPQQEDFFALTPELHPQKFLRGCGGSEPINDDDQGET